MLFSLTASVAVCNCRFLLPGMEAKGAGLSTGATRSAVPEQSAGRQRYQVAAAREPIVEALCERADCVCATEHVRIYMLGAQFDYKPFIVQIHPFRQCRSGFMNHGCDACGVHMSQRFSLTQLIRASGIKEKTQTQENDELPIVITYHRCNTCT